MALEAQKKFPDINFKKSVMIGDQVSDILFGKNLEMRCIWVPENIDTKWNQSAIEPDEIHNDLLSYAEKIDTEFHGK